MPKCIMDCFCYCFQILFCEFLVHKKTQRFFVKEIKEEPGNFREKKLSELHRTWYELQFERGIFRNNRFQLTEFRVYICTTYNANNNTRENHETPAFFWCCFGRSLRLLLFSFDVLDFCLHI